MGLWGSLLGKSGYFPVGVAEGPWACIPAVLVAGIVRVNEQPGRGSSASFPTSIY